MSMRYNAVDDYGLVIDEVNGRQIAQKLDASYPENGDDWRYILYDYGICEYICEFTGEANKLNDDGWPSWNQNDAIFYCGDSICFVQLRYPTLFKQTYRDMDDAIDDLKYKVGKYLPKDFDYRNNIYCISGVYYG